MKKWLIPICTLSLYGSVGVQAAGAQDPLAFLHGQWIGEGTTSGFLASQALTWKPALQGRFTALELHNTMSNEAGESFVFEGVAYYSATEAQEFTGIWVDSQGNIHPLKAVLKDTVLLADWGSEETELGRSEYRLLPDERLEVVDSIRNKEGEWKEFGRAVLERK